MGLECVGRLAHHPFLLQHLDQVSVGELLRVQVLRLAHHRETVLALLDVPWDTCLPRVGLGVVPLDHLVGSVFNHLQEGHHVAFVHLSQVQCDRALHQVFRRVAA